jgi:hypothetical protein
MKAYLGKTTLYEKDIDPIWLDGSEYKELHFV